MPKFNFHNKISGCIATSLPREARNMREAQEVCDAWCRITNRLPSLFEPVFVEPHETVSVIFEKDKKRGFVSCP